MYGDLWSLLYISNYISIFNCVQYLLYFQYKNIWIYFLVHLDMLYVQLIKIWILTGRNRKRKIILTWLYLRCISPFGSFLHYNSEHILGWKKTLCTLQMPFLTFIQRSWGRWVNRDGCESCQRSFYTHIGAVGDWHRLWLSLHPFLRLLSLLISVVSISSRSNIYWETRDYEFLSRAVRNIFGALSDFSIKMKSTEVHAHGESELPHKGGEGIPTWVSAPDPCKLDILA